MFAAKLYCTHRLFIQRLKGYFNLKKVIALDKSVSDVLLVLFL